MALAILTDEKHGLSCMYCNNEQWAFGPVGQRKELEAFAKWLPQDAREYPADELELLWNMFLSGAGRLDESGKVRCQIPYAE